MTRQGTDLTAHLTSVAQQEQGWDALHPELLRDLRGDVDVDLHDLEPAGKILAGLFDQRTDRAARSAPRHPQVDQHEQR